jgi:hypothetical protein
MHTGETERLPANLQILMASIIFTLVSYAVFKEMWNINVPFSFLLALLALQAATILLGNRGVLTSMGASSVAVLLSMAAYFAAVVLLFPSAWITRSAGIAGGAASAIFVLTSTITSFRAGTFDLEILDAVEIDTGKTRDLLQFVDEIEPEPDYPDLKEYLGEETEEILPDDPIDLTEGTQTLKKTGVTDRRGFKAGKQTSGRSEYGEQPAVSGTGITGAAGTDEPPVNRSAPSPGESDQFQIRCRYRVIDAATGNSLGIYYSDEGYSSVDPVTLDALLGGKKGHGELRIVNLDWSNFDEVEVQVERIPHRSNDSRRQAVHAGRTEEKDVLSPGEAAVSGEPQGVETELPEGVMELDSTSMVDTEAQRYVIYERRTMRPLGEYIPEGERPRIDRLTLYRMLPEYDFKTFQIDSIRWLEGEVGIFIKGEKKKDQ